MMINHRPGHHHGESDPGAPLHYLRRLSNAAVSANGGHKGRHYGVFACGGVCRPPHN